MTGRVVCVVPALDAAGSVGDVIRGLRASMPESCIVGIDDGSSDRTAEVLRAACDRTIVHERNRGKGAALRAGLAEALALGADTVITLDADGQHDQLDLAALVDAIAGAVLRRIEEPELALPVAQDVRLEIGECADLSDGKEFLDRLVGGHQSCSGRSSRAISAVIDWRAG